MNTARTPEHASIKGSDILKSVGHVSAATLNFLNLPFEGADKMGDLADWFDKNLLDNKDSPLKWFISNEHIPGNAKKFLNIYENTLFFGTKALGLIPNTIGVAGRLVSMMMKERFKRLRREGKISDEQLKAMHENETHYISEHKEYFKDGMYKEEAIKRVLPEFLLGLGNERLNGELIQNNDFTQVILAGRFTMDPQSFGLNSPEGKAYIKIRVKAVEHMLKKAMGNNTPSNSDIEAAVRAVLDNAINNTPINLNNPVIAYSQNNPTVLGAQRILGNYNSAQRLAETYVDSVLTQRIQDNPNAQEVNSHVDSKVRELNNVLGFNLQPNSADYASLRSAVNTIVSEVRTTGNYTSIIANINALRTQNPAPNSPAGYAIRISDAFNGNFDYLFDHYINEPLNEVERSMDIFEDILGRSVTPQERPILNGINFAISTMPVENQQQVNATWQRLSQPNNIPVLQSLVNGLYTDISAYFPGVNVPAVNGNQPPQYLFKYLKGLLKGENREILALNFIRDYLVEEARNQGNNTAVAMLSNVIPAYNADAILGGDYTRQFVANQLAGNNNHALKVFSSLLQHISNLQPLVNANQNTPFDTLTYSFDGSSVPNSPKRTNPLVVNLNADLSYQTLTGNPLAFADRFVQLSQAVKKAEQYELAVAQDDAETTKNRKAGTPAVVSTHRVAFLDALTNSPVDQLFTLIYFDEYPTGNAQDSTFSVFKKPVLDVVRRGDLVPQIDPAKDLSNKEELMEYIRRAKRLESAGLEIYSFLGLPPFASPEDIKARMKEYTSFIETVDKVMMRVPKRGANGRVETTYILKPEFQFLANNLINYPNKIHLVRLAQSGIFGLIKDRLSKNAGLTQSILRGNYNSADLEKVIGKENIPYLKVLEDILSPQNYALLLTGGLKNTSSDPKEITNEQLIILFSALGDEPTFVESMHEMRERVDTVNMLVDPVMRGDKVVIEDTFKSVYDSALSESLFNDMKLGHADVERTFIVANKRPSYFHSLDIPHSFWSDKIAVQLLAKKQQLRYQGIIDYFGNAGNLQTAANSISAAIAQSGTGRIAAVFSDLLPSNPVDTAAIDNLVYLMQEFFRANRGQQVDFAAFERWIGNVNNRDQVLNILGTLTGIRRYDAGSYNTLVDTLPKVRGVFDNRGLSFLSVLIDPANPTNLQENIYNVVNYLTYSFRNSKVPDVNIPNRDIAIREIRDASANPQAMATLLTNRHTFLSATGPILDQAKAAATLTTEGGYLGELMLHNAAIKAEREANMLLMTEKDTGFTQDLIYSLRSLYSDVNVVNYMKGRPSMGKKPNEFSKEAVYNQPSPY